MNRSCGDPNQIGPDADLTVENGGVLIVRGAVSGNTVSVTSSDLSHPSSLNFAMGDPNTSVPISAGQFAAELDLVGATKLTFNNLKIDAAVFDPTAHTLTVNVKGTDGNDHLAGVFHLGGSAAYDPSQFTVAQDGRSVIWAGTQQTS